MNYPEAKTPLTPTISGNSSATTSAPYTLNLSCSTNAGHASINGWTIYWGDGRYSVVSGNPSSISHSYSQAGTYRIIAAVQGTRIGYYTFKDGVQVTGSSPLSVSMTNLSSSSLEGSAMVFQGSTPTNTTGQPAQYAWNVVAPNTRTYTLLSLAPYLIFMPQDNGDYTVSVQAMAGDCFSPVDTRTLSITNMPPSDVSLGYTISGQTASLSGSFTDPGWDDTHTITINWGDGSPNTVLTPAVGTRSFNYSHQYWDDNAADQYTISVSVSDNKGGSNSLSSPLTVYNVAPNTVTLGGDSGGRAGQSFSLTGSFADPGTLDTHTVTINWGDASPNTVLSPTTGSRSFSTNHTYATAGTYTITATVSDDDGGSASGSRQVPIDPGDGSIAGPDGYGYRAYAYGYQAINLSLGDPGVSSIDALNSVDDASVALDLGGNSFNFYGATYNSLYVSSNGLITFGTANAAYSNTDLTTSPAERAIAPLWDDLVTYVDSIDLVLYKLQSNQLILEWSDVHPIGSAGTFTFQAILQLNTGSAMGDIIFNYVDLDSGDSRSNSATASVGIKDSGTQGYNRLLISQDAPSPYVGSGKAIRIVKPFVNTRPSIDWLSLSPTSIDENGTTILSGSFTDPDGADSHTITINWGDGSANTVLTPAAGTRSFSTPAHRYLDDDPSGTSSDSYLITVTVSDGQATSDPKTATVTVRNVAPSNLVVQGGTATEGTAFTLSGNFVDPGTRDTHTVTIDWGDSSQPTTLNLAAGVMSFSSPHVYADNGSYVVSVTVSDDDGGSCNNSASTAGVIGGPDGFGYRAYSPSYQYTDLYPGNPGVSSILDGTDDNYVPLDLGGSSFNFYGTTYTSLYISSNGLITFGSGNNSTANSDLTTSPAERAIAPLWDDWVTYADSYDVVLYQFNPNQLIIEWNEVRGYVGAPNYSPSGVSFEAVLQLNTGSTPGDITFNYLDLDAGDGRSNGVTASVGIKDGGTQGPNRLLISCNSTSSYVGSYKSLRFNWAAPTTVTVTNALPVVSAPAAQSGENGSNVSWSLGSFSDLGLNDSPWTVDVDWGDGSTHTPFTATAQGSLGSQAHPYANPGSYTVTVQVTDKDGGVGSQSFPVTVQNLAPVVSVPASATLNEGGTFTASGSFTDSGTGPWTVTVNYGDGSGEQPLTLRADKTFDLSHLYANSGPYTVSVKVSDGLMIGQSPIAVAVNNLAPMAFLSGPGTGTEGSKINLTASATDPSPADTAAGFIYTWTIKKNGADFASGNGAAIEFTPDAGGTYLASVTAQDIEGAVSLAATKSIDVAALPRVSIVASDPNASEPGSDTGTFTISRTGDTTSALTVCFSVGGSATNGTDYNSIGTLVTILAGAASASVVITPKDDASVEGNETVILNLGSSAGYVLAAPTSATVTLADNDVALPVVTVSVTDATASEPGTDTGKFTITRTGSTTAALTIYFTAGGTATAGSDYTSLGTSITIPAGSASATLTLMPLDDDLLESSETVVLTLSANAAYSLGSQSSASISLTDDDANVTIVDNTDSSGVSITGDWVASTYTSGYYGSNYIHDNNTGKGAKSVQYSPVLTPGTYQVFLRWTTGTNRATNVPVDIVHAGGTAPLTVNERVGGGTWSLLGTYSFAATGGSVKIRTDGTDGHVIADAVRFKLISPDQAPSIGSLAASPEPAIVGDMLTLTATGVSDADGTIGQVKFYRESNGQVGLQAGTGGDTLLGTASSSPYTLSVSTAGLAIGTHIYYAQATDNLGVVSNAASTTGTVIAPPLLVDITDAPTTSPEGTTITLGSSVTNNTGQTPSYVWSVTPPSGKTYAADVTTGSSFIFTPYDNGSYQVSCTVSAGGYTHTDTKSVTITNVNPGSLILNGGSGTVGQSFDFSGGFADPGLDDTHTITISWGDGTANTVLTPTAGTRSFSTSHTYATAGTYTISTSVTDDDGGVSSPDEETITVDASQDNALEVSIIGIPETATEGEYVSLTCRVSNPQPGGITYKWTVTPTNRTVRYDVGKSLSFQLQTQGTYTVELQVTSGTQTATATASIFATEPALSPKISGAPVVGFNMQDDEVHVPYTLHLGWKNPVFEVSPTANWEIDWGDGVQETLSVSGNRSYLEQDETVTHTYTLPGGCTGQTYTIHAGIKQADGVTCSAAPLRVYLKGLKSQTRPDPSDLSVFMPNDDVILISWLATWEHYVNYAVEQTITLPGSSSSQSILLQGVSNSELPLITPPDKSEFYVGQNTQLQIMHPIPGAKYSFRVKASGQIYEEGQWVWYETPYCAAASVDVPFHAPSDLEVNYDPEADRFHVTWLPHSDNEESFEITWMDGNEVLGHAFLTGSENEQMIPWTPPRDASIAAGGTYTFSIAAYYDFERSNFFEGAGTIAVRSVCPITVQVTLPPAAPSNVRVMALSETQVHLTWDEVPGADYYRIYRSSDNGANWTTLADGITGTSYDDSTCSPGVQYSYVVQAVNEGGESADSATASVTTPEAKPPDDGILDGNDDSSSELCNLGFTINFYGRQFSSVYVNNNGNLTFQSSLWIYTPDTPFWDMNLAIIAPFFADVDTRTPGGSGSVSYGAATVDGRPAFQASWTGVGYYNCHSDKTNTFSVQLVDRSDVQPGDFDILFIYDNLAWETGDASGGSEGTGGTPARAGYSNGTGEADTYYELPGSGASGGLLGLTGQRKYEIRNTTRVSELTVKDHADPTNSVSNTSADEPSDLYVAEDDNGQGQIDIGGQIALNGVVAPGTAQLRQRACWKLLHNGSPLSSGTFASTTPVMLTRDSGGGDFLVQAGFDTNDNHQLDADEITQAVNVHLLRVDLAIDSNNDGSIAAADDALEDDDTKPGKVVLIGDWDSDSDGVPDSADGFNLYETLAADEISPGLKFTPISLDLGSALPPSTLIRLSYSASDPADIGMSLDNPYIWPDAGSLRIWRVDGEPPESARFPPPARAAGGF